MLQYDQPIGQAKPEPRPPSSAAFNLLDLVGVLWRRRLMIAGAALIGACVFVAVGKSLTPRYTASAQLYVDPRELQLVDRELTPRSQDTSGLTMVVESQARLITSNQVLLHVIKETNLEKDPEFGGGTASRGVFGTLLGLVGLELKPTAEQRKAGEVATLDALGRHITIRKTERSFIVDVEVWSIEPEKAAVLANAVANAYLTESRKSQSSAARRATTDLSGRLKELSERLRNAENALATYKAQNNFVGTQDTLISDQQLSASNQRLAAARALTLDAQAKYDQIEASRRASTDAGAIPEALQSPTIANLRAQYADARKRQAELMSELGPRHPALRQVEQQVNDLKRNINEELDRFVQSARNDVTRAREYEASLGKALETQKRMSVQMSQASVQLRQLEREVEASRDVYQSFLKRSRETEEQESLNTSAARITGEATVPQRRTFPPAMSLLAMVGFMFGGLAAAGWTVAADQLKRHDSDIQPKTPAPPASTTKRTAVASAKAAPASPAPRPQQATPTRAEKPLIARLQESDVVRTLGGIFASGGMPDATRMGWPTPRAGQPTAFAAAMHEIRTRAAQRSVTGNVPVMAVIGTGAGPDRSIAAMNIALAAAREGANVLVIDADHAAHTLSDKVVGFGKAEPSRLGWLSIGSKASRAIKTANGISILPALRGSDAKASEAIRKAIAQARSAGGYDLVILDGPAMPGRDADRKLIEIADGLVAILPVSLDINQCMEEIIESLDGAERKLVGVVLNELNPTHISRQRDQQYA
jgi:uncharacterized protein involved in exopolysaccharide biosynthesis/Mrp family chromosome partitioning ATPase